MSFINESNSGFFGNVVNEDIQDKADNIWKGKKEQFDNPLWNKTKLKKSTETNSNNNNDKNALSPKSNNSNEADRFIPHRGVNKLIKTQVFEIQKHDENEIKNQKLNQLKVPKPATNDENDDTNLTLNSNENTNCKKKNLSKELDQKEEFKSCLKSSLLSRKNNIIQNDSNIFTYKEKAPISLSGYFSNLSIVYKTKNNTHKNGKNGFRKRHVDTSAEKVLDAPEILDDFYANILDWSCQNIIGIALGSIVYLFNCETGDIYQFYENSETNPITSLKFSPNGNHISIGTQKGFIGLFDVQKQKQLRAIETHSMRVGSLSWNNHILSTGSQDTIIGNHDVRKKNYLISKFKYHEQEICGLKWDNDSNGKYLACGGNDNVVSIWEINQISQSVQIPTHEFKESCAAVKALAWCPWQNNLLATGGGTGDRNIRIYDVINGTCTKQIDTESQVCSLVWNPHDKELLSSHGFSQNQLSIWKYPQMARTHNLNGHTARVLHTALSPDGARVCSAASDETLRFWKVFDLPQKNQNNSLTFNDINVNGTKSRLFSKIR